MNDHKNEQWRPISGYRGLYSASDHGRVRSEARGNAHILRPVTSDSGRQVVMLSVDDTFDIFFVDQLVLEAFRSKRPDRRHEEYHLDGDKTNNHIGNLTWVERGNKPPTSQTAQPKADRPPAGDGRNQRTAAQGAGRQAKPRPRATGKVTPDKALAIYRAKGTNRQVAERFGVTIQTASKIRNGDRWARYTINRNKPKVWPVHVRLTVEQVREIYNSEEAARQIAARLGVHHSTVSNVRNGRNWAQYTGHQPGSRPVELKITAEQVRTIYNAKGTLKEIAAQFGISIAYAGMIRRGQSRTKDSGHQGKPAQREKKLKITPGQVRAIYNAKGTQAEIANRFGVSVSTVAGIRKGRTWTQHSGHHEGNK